MRRSLACVVLAASLCACAGGPRVPENASRAASANEAWRRGDAVAGRRAYAEALREDRLAADESAAVRHLNNLAALDAWTGADRASEERLLDAIARCAGPDAESDRRRLEMQRAALLLRRGAPADLADASALLGVRADREPAAESPMERWAGIAPPADASQYWTLRSSLALRAGRRDDALAAAHRARDAASSAAAPAESRAAAALALGRALEASSPAAREEARASYDAALAAAGEARHPWLRLAALRALAAATEGEERARFARLAADLAQELEAAK